MYEYKHYSDAFQYLSFDYTNAWPRTDRRRGWRVSYIPLAFHPEGGVWRDLLVRRRVYWQCRGVVRFQKVVALSANNQRPRTESRLGSQITVDLTSVCSWDLKGVFDCFAIRIYVHQPTY